METIKEVYWPAVRQFFQDLAPEHWGIGGISLALIIVLYRFARRKSGNKRIVPSQGLQINLFQIAPLGRDAFLKLFNPGQKVTLSQLKVVGRTDIAVKNAAAGHVLESGSLYSLLLEATGAQRLEANFALELTYLDANGIAWRQTLAPGQQQQKGPVVVKR